MRGSEFGELTAFAAIIEHGSFARAAAQLGVSPSALSQTIRALEDRLGVRLLNRTTRSVAPTDAGQRLIARLAPALRQIEAAVADVDELRDQPGGTLRINIPRAAATHLIAPILGKFHQAYPRVRLEVFTDDTITDIVAGRFDAGIRLGERLEKDMVAVKIGDDLEMAAVASPAYLKAHGTPGTPADLHQHRCINWRMATNGNLYRWEFERGREELEIAVEGAFTANEIELVRRAALDGVGIAYTLRHEVQPWIDSGELIRVLEEWSPRFPGFYLYYPSRRQLPPALKALIELLRKAG